MSGVTTKRAEYNTLLPEVTKNRDAVKGERAIKARGAGYEYLPPLPSMCISTTINEQYGIVKTVGTQITVEGQVSYNNYLSLAYFYNASGRTVAGLVGLIFAKKPNKELPASLDYLNDNIDGKGSTLRDFSQQVTQEAFVTPKSGILVEYPTVNKRITRAQARALNLRPKLIHYRFESIINWHYETINNETKLTFLVLEEYKDTRDKFTIKTVKQYRVLELIEGIYTQTVFDEKGAIVSDPVQPKINNQPMTTIPFFEVKAGQGDKAVIDDLVDANLNHYRFFAGYAAKENASAFPVLYETGVTGDSTNVVIGPGVKWESTHTDAQFGVLQTESDGGSMRTYLQDMETRMAALGAEMLKPRINQAESAEAKSLDQVAQNSTTADVAITVSEVIRKALQLCVEWSGSSDKVVFELNTDYNPEGMNPQMLTALFNAYQSGGISFETFYSNLQKGEIADPDVSAEDEQARITIADSGL